MARTGKTKRSLSFHAGSRALVKKNEWIQQLKRLRLQPVGRDVQNKSRPNTDLPINFKAVELADDVLAFLAQRVRTKSATVARP